MEVRPEASLREPLLGLSGLVKRLSEPSFFSLRAEERNSELGQIERNF